MTTSRGIGGGPRPTHPPETGERLADGGEAHSLGPPLYPPSQGAWAGLQPRRCSDLREPWRLPSRLGHAPPRSAGHRPPPPQRHGRDPFRPAQLDPGVGFARKHQCPCTGSGSARHRQSLDKSEYTIAAGTLVLEHGQQVPDCCRLARRQRVNCELHAVRVPTRPSRTLVGPITVRGRRTVCGAPGGAARKTIGRPTPACVRLPAAAVSRSRGRPAPRPSTAARVIAVPLRRRAAPGQRCRRGPESDLTRPQSSARWRGWKRNSAPGCSSNRPGGSRPRRPGGLFRVTRSKVFGWQCAEPSLPGLRAACPRLSMQLIPTGTAVDF